MARMVEHEPLVGWDQGDGDIAMQLQASDLPPEKQGRVRRLWKDLEQDQNRAWRLTWLSMWSGILQASFGAAVPILIGFGESLKGTSFALFGRQRDLREVLEMSAAIISLMGTICGLVDRGSRLRQRGHAKMRHVEKCQVVVRRFLARQVFKDGKLTQFSSHDEAYPYFNHEVCILQEVFSESKFLRGTGSSEDPLLESKRSLRIFSDDADSRRRGQQPSMSVVQCESEAKDDGSHDFAKLMNQKVRESLQKADRHEFSASIATGDCCSH